MIPELGHFALVLALVLAAVQGSIPFVGALRGDSRWMDVARPAAVGQLGAIALAFAALTHAYVVSDFTLANVVENSHSAKPMLYKVTGVWGNHEGSMLLWVLMLALCGAGVAVFGRNLPATLKARVLSVQAWIALGFLSFSLLTSNPFERVANPPLDGNDLNPLLQDPGLAFHPPLLYLGYVGFSVAFSFAVAALLEGRVDAAWARWVRPWTLAAWCSLTGGIALGSWWAYYELGWGGWWFWDPVENVSFMPWLLGTALLHSAIVVEKRDTLKAWTILLAILTFSLSLMGTFIVRSGLLTSVHAFAVDPERGSYILGLMGIATGGSLALFAWRAPVLKAGGLFAPVSREGGLLLNNLLLATATATVLIGTLYPLFLEALTGGRVSIGPPFYNYTFVPLMLPLVGAMGIGPFLAWKRADLAGVLGRLRMAALLAVVVALATWYLQNGGPVLAVLAMGFAVWLLAATLIEWAERVRLFRIPLADSWRRARGLPRSAYGMSLAHAGLAVCIIGMIGSSAWKEELVEAVQPGDSLQIAGFTLTLQDVETRPGPNYRSTTGVFEVTRDGRTLGMLEPERRYYPVAGRSTTEAAIRTNGLGDLYATINEPPEEGQDWTARIYYEPLVPWIWVGSAMMMFGGILSLADRRLRVGAPRRAARQGAQPPAAAE
ncbi:heme lyase CcmF/NrfE family subunit [Fodinicurvata fenggangensis]|uniref:heme lyase CcmF/NrfE family subunit n=1 Tax=Fodinicurvata fenggangensis TaxID=1121830 RepID=UPI000478B7D4|nr:heme lyase CcmF/NrfE family subunit [Fodinicurvata fenggangensis]